MGAGFWVNLIAGTAAGGLVVWAVLGWLDRQVGAPVMRERINKGSDAFFDDENKNLGAVTLDKIVRLKFEDEPAAATPQSPSESSPRARVARSSDSA